MSSDKINVDLTKQEVMLFLNTKVYKTSCILEAADMFSDACWVNTDGDPQETMKVVLKPRSDDISLKTLGYEFYNYVLALMRNHNMV